MIFTQEAPLTRKWFSWRSCIRSNWNKLGVNDLIRLTRSPRNCNSTWAQGDKRQLWTDDSFLAPLAESQKQVNKWTEESNDMHASSQIFPTFSQHVGHTLASCTFFFIKTTKVEAPVNYMLFINIRTCFEKAPLNFREGAIKVFRKLYNSWAKLYIALSMESLSKDNADDSENVILKLNFAFLQYKFSIISRHYARKICSKYPGINP